MADNVSVQKFKDHFDDFVDQTHQEREKAEKRRDYRDLKQWTESEAAALSARGQAPIVFDQFGKKVDAIGGLEVQRRSDPKAYPVTPKHDKAADAITDALRYVESRTQFDSIASEVFEDKIVEGYGGAIVEYNKDTDDIEINQLDWDRIYYDPHSRRKDFSDATYFGITIWMDRKEAQELYPDKSDEIQNAVINNGQDGTTFEDRPKWIDTKRDRVRINQEYYLDKGTWKEVFFSGDTILVEPKDSPYLDARGNPSNPIELESDFVDRDNGRYGYTQRLIDVQDEINHRRSKSLHQLTHKTVIADRGAFGNTSRAEVLAEMAKGNTFLEPLQNARVEIRDQQELGQTQFSFYQDARAAMDSIGINPELSGSTESAISGRAFIARQQGGMVELEKIFTRHGEWKERIYNQIWARIKQFWDEEKWVRVTDDEKATKFVGLNVPITRFEKELEQRSGMDINDLNDKFGDEIEVLRNEAVSRDPRMGETVEKRNDVAKMHMDIVIEEAPDTISIQQEQFEVVSKLITTGVDKRMLEALLELSSLPKKDKVIDMLKGEDTEQEQKQAEAQQQQLQQQLIATQMENAKADTAVKQSTAAKNMAQTQVSLADVTLKEAQAKDEIASAMERIGKVSTLPFDQKTL